MGTPFPAGQSNLAVQRLDPTVREPLERAGKEVDHERGSLLFSRATPLKHVYFPYSGMISIVVSLTDGSRIETHTIGREGIVGVPFFQRPRIVGNMEALCQMPSRGLRVPVDDFRKLVEESETLAELTEEFNQLVIGQIAQSAACNRLHQLDERLARWLLHAHDRAGSDELPLTHELLAEMLGVRRETISLALGSLERAGVLGHRRGHVSIEDRAGLERVACECYAVIRAELDLLLRLEIP